MVFSSVTFLTFFLPCLLACYFLVPKKLRSVRNVILLVFSLVFYACGGPKFLILMLISITVNYVCGLFAAPQYHMVVRRLSTAAAVLIGIGLLGYFKYAGFFAEIINSMGMSVPVPEITLPIGISFYTFQGLGYVIDVCRGDADVQKNPLKVALYISLFPQLVAGPIVRYTTVEMEISNRNERIDEISDGIVRFIFGLAKKMILANSMGEIADAAFAQNTGDLSAAFAWLGALAYTGQIYFDFSAYSDMAIGLGRVFGFHFLENFNYPYISKSVTEFWRRWHISLSSWFRDYIYIPLGGSYCSKKRQVFNMFVVWACTGMWHGAAWNFIVWGMWFFVLLVGEKYIWGRGLEKMPSVIQHIYALLAAVISWVFFRAEDLPYAFGYLKAMFFAGGGLLDGQAVYYFLEYLPELILCVIAAMPVKRLVENALRRRAGLAPVAAIDANGALVTEETDCAKSACAEFVKTSQREAHDMPEMAANEETRRKNSEVSEKGETGQADASDESGPTSRAKPAKTGFARLLLIWGPKLLALCLLILAYAKLVTGSFNPFIYFRF